MSVIFHRLMLSALVLASLAVGGCCSRTCAPRNGALDSHSVSIVTPAAHVTPVASGDYVAAPADVLKITIYGEDDLSGEYTVGPDGAVALPLVGAVGVAGQSLDMLPELIANAYRKGYLKNPKVSVEVKGRGV